MPKRLFLMAGYDKDSIIDSALVYYINTLSRYGDVVLCMDNKFNGRQIRKLKIHPLSVFITRHREYDFGSYKRAFQFAVKNDILKNYDYLYLVNDSVFGPTTNLKKTLQNIEALPSDAASIIISKHQTHSFMESWFVRLNKNIFMSEWFSDFINSVTKQPTKEDVTIKYEHGLSQLITQNKCTWSGLYTVYGRETYNHPKQLFKRGCPFIKKVSFTRHNGALGNQIKYILNHCDQNAKDTITKTSNRLYGKKYMKWFLTSNPFKILYRNLTYGITKLKNGNI